MKSFFKKIALTILWWQARLVIRKYRPKIVVVADGDNRELAKQVIFNILSKKYLVRKSQNFEKESVPTAILSDTENLHNIGSWLSVIYQGVVLIWSRKSYPEWLVIDALDRSFLKPDISVILSSNQSSARHFINPVLRLKRGGTLILNADDKNAMSLKWLSQERVLTFGLKKEATIQGSNYKLLREEEGKKIIGLACKADYEGNSFPLIISGLQGKHLLYPILASILVAITAGMPAILVVEILQSLSFGDK